MTISELKKGLLDLMQSNFPAKKYKYYAMDVKEGYKRPSFFTKLKPVSMEASNYNTRNNQVMFIINFMQERIDEVEALATIQQIRDLFGLSVKIGDRAVDVTGFDFDFVGSEQNIPEITIDLEWMDRIEHTVDEPVMKSVEINRKME